MSTHQFAELGHAGQGCVDTGRGDLSGDHPKLLLQPIQLVMQVLHLADCRRRHKEGHDQGQRDDPVELFESLYRSFSHSCCAVLSLCIHAGAYAHACEVLDCLGTKLEVTSNQLLELDRLVQVRNGRTSARTRSYSGQSSPLCTHLTLLSLFPPLPCLLTAAP